MTNSLNNLSSYYSNNTVSTRLAIGMKHARKRKHRHFLQHIFARSLMHRHQSLYVCSLLKFQNCTSFHTSYNTKMIARLIPSILILLPLLLCINFHSVHSLSIKAPETSKTTPQKNNNKKNNARTYSFSVPLINARPKPDSFTSTFMELWNDPRPITSLIATDDRSFVGERENPNQKGTMEEIPYCIISDEFQIGDNGNDAQSQSHSFQILLYPRGRIVRDYSSTEGLVTGSASAYLRYLPKQYGDEIDIGWKLRLVDTRTSTSAGIDKPLSVETSGGLPRSKDTWTSAITFCTEMEAVESVGRATDWGSSSWSAKEVCDALGALRAEGEMIVYGTRSDESALSWPPGSKGGLGAVRYSVVGSSARNGQREFRAGEVIVPTEINGFENVNEQLRQQYIYPGIDYRIMTMSDKDGNAIFSTKDMEESERNQVKLALRPCGWKAQSHLWQKSGKQIEWPVEVNSDLLSSVSLTRFNIGSAIPRVVAAFQRDWVAYTFALLVAITPIPLALVARNAVSLYAIPSASMEPTLLKGDVLLVEKFPRVYDRTQRGDVILFRPPQTLRDIVMNNGSQLSSTSLFVKRIVGLPGDKNIKLIGDNDIMVNGSPAVGPDRSLCADEPLRLIEKFLETGKGKNIEELGANDVYVLGDCKAVSVDSRVFGILPKENIVGRPLARVWPLSRFQVSGKL